MTFQILRARFNMTASIMSQGGFDSTPESSTQDPDTGEVIRNWIKDTDLNTGAIQKRTFACVARGIVPMSMRGAGTEIIYNTDGTVKTTDFIRIQYGSETILTSEDKITDITNKKGELVWTEEQHGNTPTIFIVMGVTPTFDPWGNHLENTALCSRAEVQ